MKIVTYSFSASPEIMDKLLKYAQQLKKESKLSIEPCHLSYEHVGTAEASHLVKMFAVLENLKDYVAKWQENIENRR